VLGAPLVLSTASARERLGGPVRVLGNWESYELGGGVRVTGVPAQHGPDGSEHLVGEVTGFVVEGEGLPRVYVSGDNASLDVVRGVAGRFGPVDVAVLFAGPPVRRWSATQISRCPARTRQRRTASWAPGGRVAV
jgi:L-ascorbate metabolism protein UlaG (beta-lactamase superfamily)